MTSKTLTLYQHQGTARTPTQDDFHFQMYDFGENTDSQQSSYEYWLEHTEYKVITLDAEEGVND